MSIGAKPSEIQQVKTILVDVMQSRLTAMIASLGSSVASR